ncbi:MAG: tyrosine-type recombinase/integrase [Candidatus Binatia bacterium]
MPKYKHGSGSVYKRGKTWWISYYANGERVRESAETTDKAEARRKLQERMGQIAEGRFVGPAADRVTFEQLMEGLRVDYQVNAKKSLADVEVRIRKHLTPFFAGRRAHEITTKDVQTYIASRQEEGARRGTINRELAALKRAFNLALQAGQIVRKPHFPMLAENNARQGFFEQWEYEAVLAKLPDYLRPAASFAYLTGWRLRSEVLKLRWQQIDFETGTVRLEVGTTKNKEGRLLYLTDELRALLVVQRQEVRAAYPECPWVFPRYGKPVEKGNRSWNRACREAGLVGKIPHDFRRTAVRNMVRAGIPERVAMQMSGHKTRSVFDRYHIVSDGDLREAAQKLNRAVPQPNGHNFSHNFLPTEENAPLSH